MRFDRADDPLHPLHHRGEIHCIRADADAELARMCDVGEQARGTDQCLGGHATGVQAVAAHLVFLDERDPRTRGRADVGRDQPGTAGADDDHVVVEPGRTGGRPACIHPPRLQPLRAPARDQRKYREQCERGDEARRDAKLAELAAGEHIDQRAGQHRQLAHPVERPDAQSGESHQQVHEPKRKHDDQPQGGEVERAVPLDAFVDLLQAVGEPLLHPVAEQRARDQERERCADRRRERHQHRAQHDTEEGATDERQRRSARNAQRRDRDVNDEVGQRHRQRVRGIQRLDPLVLCLEELDRENSPQIECKEGGDRCDQHAEQQPTLRVQGGVLSADEGDRGRAQRRRDQPDARQDARTERPSASSTVNCGPSMMRRRYDRSAALPSGHRRVNCASHAATS